MTVNMANYLCSLTAEQLKDFLSLNGYSAATCESLFNHGVTGKMFCQFGKEEFLLLDVKKGPTLSFLLLKERWSCKAEDLECDVHLPHLSVNNE